MTRVDDLQKKYPSIPRDVIVKYDVIVRGVRANADLDKASVWKPASHVYQSREYEGTLQELADKTPWRVRPGHILRPLPMRFRSGLGADVRLRSTGVYAVKELGEGEFALYEGEERVQDVFFLRPKPRTTPEPMTSRGTPISTLIDFLPCCFWVTPTRYCQYFSTGDQCKFCNLNVGHEDARSVGLGVPITIDPEETVEAYKIRSSEVRQVEGNLVMGGFMKAEQEAKIHLEFVEKLATATSYKPNLTVHTQAMERKDMQRLKDAGVEAFVVQIEVMHPKLFPEICPGKAKHMPYEGWVEAIHNAADIFGAGNAAAKFVPGITLLAPNGHETWQAARDYHIEANTYLIRNGVLPAYTPLYPSPGAPYFRDKPNLERLAPTEFYMEVGLAHHEAMLKYGLYGKMNKFQLCGLDVTTGTYTADIGMLELAGDVGNWMADVVPDESNWLAKFIASVRLPT